MFRFKHLFTMVGFPLMFPVLLLFNLDFFVYIVSRMAHDSHSVLTRFLIAFWLTSVLCNFSNTNNMNNVGRKRGRRRKITIIFCVRLSRRIIDYWQN